MFLSYVTEKSVKCVKYERRGRTHCIKGECRENWICTQCRGENDEGASLNTGATNTSLIQVYAPQQGQPQQEKDDFYQQLVK